MSILEALLAGAAVVAAVSAAIHLAVSDHRRRVALLPVRVTTQRARGAAMRTTMHEAKNAR